MILPAPYWVSYIELIRMVGGVPVVVEATEAEQFKLTLPPTCRILSLPPKVTINAPGIMNFNRVLKSEGSSLVGDNYFSIDTVELSPDGYGELKKALAELDAVEGALAIGGEMTLDELIATIHSHPTVTETIHEAALSAEKRAIHIKN